MQKRRQMEIKSQQQETWARGLEFQDKANSYPIKTNHCLQKSLTLQDPVYHSSSLRTVPLK